MLLAVLPVFAQSVQDLKSKYGDARLQTFQVRPGVGVTVRMSPNGGMAEMLIAPISADTLVDWSHPALTRDAAKSVLDDLVPRSARGKFLMGTFLDIVCLPENDCAGTSEDYQNVKITYYSARTAGEVRCVHIRFKK